MFFSAARRARRLAGLPGYALLALMMSGSLAIAADHGFPYDGVLQLEAKPIEVTHIPEKSGVDAVP